MQNESPIEDVSKNDSSSFRKWGFRGDVLLIGVLFPILTLLIELFTGVCSEFFLDPIPTVWHVLLVAFVPISNAYFFWTLFNNRFERPTLFGWASSISIGISVFFSLIFLPVLPISLIGIVFYGLGFLGLAPMLSALGTFFMRKGFRAASNSTSFVLDWRGTLLGFLIAFVVVGVSEFPFLASRHAMQMINSPDSEKQKRGFWLMKNFGDETYLLRLTNNFRGRLYISDTVYSLFAGGARVASGENSREVYYRLTGKTIDESAIPTRFGFGESDRVDWRNKHLSLVSSEMEGSIDNDASLGYLEWIFEFKNDAEFGNAEAIAQIQLPPDSVVSRVTLWIDGEEREAAYAERSRVTNAYEKVVSSQRDPVLVNTSGKDRVDLKCFPVLAKGGKMKMKIGITFPLALEDKKSGLLTLPYFRGKNFRVGEGFSHQIQMLSTDMLESSDKGLKLKQDGEYFLLNGEVRDVDVRNSKSTIRADRSEQINSVWAKYEKSFVKQEIVERTGEKPERIIFVLDTSAAIAEEKERIISAIRGISGDVEIGLVLTHGNALNSAIAYPNSVLGTAKEVAKKIEEIEFGGGTDNFPALIRASEMLSDRNSGVVVWIHAPQPFLFSSSQDLAKKLIRSPYKTTIYNFAIGTGFDEVGKQFDDMNFLVNAPRFKDVQSDLERLISQFDQTTRSLAYSRTIAPTADKTAEKKTSKHMIRLWALDEINGILASKKHEKTAIDLAVKHQLVTPVTGAVVLETKQQYEDAGLKPVEKNVVHAVPESQSYLLMLIGLVFVFFFLKRRFSIF